MKKNISPMGIRMLPVQIFHNKMLEKNTKKNFLFPFQASIFAFLSLMLRGLRLQVALH